MTFVFTTTGEVMQDYYICCVDNECTFVFEENDLHPTTRLRIPPSGWHNAKKLLEMAACIPGWLDIAKAN